MSKKSGRDSHPEDERPSVRLHPILGVRPGVYLSVLYSTALVLLIFFLLVYPGIRKNGSYVFFDAYPGSIDVKVDGAYAGSAPGTIFVKSGSRSIELSKPFYASQSFRVVVRGRIFASLFFPSRMRLSHTLSVSDSEGLSKESLSDFASNQSIPQLISETSWAAYVTKKTDDSETIRRILYDFLYKCMFYVTSENQLAEAFKASFRVATSGTFLTIGNYLSLLQKIIQVKEDYDNSPALILLALSRAHTKLIASSAWISDHFAKYRETLSQYYQSFNTGGTSGGAGASLVIDGTVFRRVPAGVLVMGKDDNVEMLGNSIDPLLPHPVAVDSFYLSETEVTNRQYKEFVDRTPYWRPSNRNDLVGKGLATQDYLRDWNGDEIPPGRENLPVTSVSWNAAAAYCDWFTVGSQAVVPGSVARLPLESEWEWAARGNLRGMPYPLGERPGRSVFFEKGIAGPSKAGTSEPNGYGLRDMMGNVWEWCAGGFGPSDYLLSSLDPRRNAGLVAGHPVTGDRPVRGGGWSNMRELVRVYTRGAQPSDWCTPYLGFRVAVSRR